VGSEGRGGSVGRMNNRRNDAKDTRQGWGKLGGDGGSEKEGRGSG